MKRILTTTLIAATVFSSAPIALSMAGADQQQEAQVCNYNIRFKTDFAPNVLEAFRKLGRITYGIDDIPVPDESLFSNDEEKEEWEEVKKAIERQRRVNKELYRGIDGDRIGAAIEANARYSALYYLASKSLSGINKEEFGSLDMPYSHLFAYGIDAFPFLSEPKHYDTTIALLLGEPVSSVKNAEVQFTELWSDANLLFNKTPSILDAERARESLRKFRKSPELRSKLLYELSNHTTFETGPEDLKSKEELLREATKGVEEALRKSDFEKIAFIYAIVVQKQDPMKSHEIDTEKILNDKKIGDTAEDAAKKMKQEILEAIKTDEEAPLLTLRSWQIHEYSKDNYEDFYRTIGNVLRNNISGAEKDLWDRDQFLDYRSYFDEYYPQDNDSRRIALFMVLFTAFDVYNRYEEDCLPDPTPTTVTATVTTPTTVVTETPTTITTSGATVTTTHREPVPTTSTSVVKTPTTVEVSTTISSVTTEPPVTVENPVPVTIQPPAMIQKQHVTVGPKVHTGGSIDTSLLTRMIAFFVD